jgi:DUF309 family protein family protein
MPPAPDSSTERPPRPGTIRQGDRDKALRPLTLEQRRHAFDAGLAAYERGDFFEAHEELEPAWMGTDDLAERALHQGLIKVAAGYVHLVRGNPPGLVRNLQGARKHLALAGPAGQAERIADPDRAASEPPPAITRTPVP